MRLGKFICPLLWVLSLPAGAEPYGAADYPEIKRFPNSEIVQYASKYEPDYRFILGGLEKVNGVVRPEKEERIKGQLTRITYRIPDNHLAAEAFAFYLDQIKTLGAEVLFQCQGRACGSSNQWANDIFGYFRLYGPDAEQSFAAAKAGERYISLYSITRGNKRVYTHLEVVEAPGAAPTVSQSWSDSAFKLASDADLKELATRVIQSGDQVWLVTYAFEGDSKAAQIESARAQLSVVRDQLITLGVAAEKIRLYPLGGFLLPGMSKPSTEIFAYTDAYKGSGND
ncbi:DUF4892 domain-containing protein [Neptuniibacter sp. CAU 1671]|uniref:DUF4892 domain-containing protein n=1 Tax=Neptuniibacter sp. CAU 1671 TaxID=3032593 RepID=UPI0023DAB7CA|nr:DUF4892 domain-containing protein [Neptuniibacter sp. CAU 1671]MDF2182931.1 DUF4892 domain-containing protein [Neptuniibacter sp. CAU 1671]